MRWPLQQVTKVLSAGVGKGRLSTQGIGPGALGQCAFAVDGAPERVEHPAEPGAAGVDQGGAVVEIGTRAKAHAVQRSQRHDLGPSVPETHDFTGNARAVGAQKAHLSPQAHGACRTRHLDQKAFDPGHSAEAQERGYGLDFLEQRLHLSPAILWGLLLHFAGKGLSAGKLNETNQGDGVRKDSFLVRGSL
jgi:hypothetical protein